MTLEESLKTQFINQRQKAMLNLFFTSNLLWSIHNRVFKQYGITAQQYNVLRILKGQGIESEVKVGTIKERLLEREGDVTRVLDNLVKKGLVTRRNCSNDRRVVKVSISNEGLTMLEKIHPEVKKLEDLLSQLDDIEVGDLNKILDKMRNHPSLSRQESVERVA